jgi:hypothetical protein
MKKGVTFTRNPFFLLLVLVAPRESNTAPTDYEQRTLLKHPPKFKSLPSVRKSLRMRCDVLLASVKNIDSHLNSVT